MYDILRKCEKNSGVQYSFAYWYYRTGELGLSVTLLFQFKILKTWQLIKQMTSNFSAQEKQKALFLIITYLG